MIAITCAAKNGAMIFNNRRCSKDREVISDIVGCFKNIKIREFSSDLFENDYAFIISSAEQLSDTDVFFFEDIPFCDVSDKVSTLIVYRWDRVYPKGTSLDIDEHFRLISQTEIKGYSHDKIIKEIYSNEKIL